MVDDSSVELYGVDERDYIYLVDSKKLNKEESSKEDG